MNIDGLIRMSLLEAERDAALAELRRVRPVVDAAKVVVDHAHRSTAPRTPMFQALIDAMDALWVEQHTASSTPEVPGA